MPYLLYNRGMVGDSLYDIARKVEMDIHHSLKYVHSLDLASDVREKLVTLKRDAADARVAVRDYMYADTKSSQVKASTAIREQLVMVRQGVLAASQHDIFSSSDVAELSAYIDYLHEHLG
jgi:hypothetical protein